MAAAEGQERRPRREEPVQRDRRRRSGSKSYAEIQNLSLEERLAYYKQQYQSEGGDVAPKSTAPKMQVPAPAKSVHKPTVAPIRAKESNEVKQPEQKKGFFAGLFGRKK